MMVDTAVSVPLSVSAARRRWLGLAVLLCGSFETVLDATIVQIAIPSIAGDLHAGAAALELLIAGYSLGYGVLLITGGRLGDMHGRKRIYLIGMAAFTLASALCGLAPDATTLVGARVLQGMTASLVLPQVLASIRIGFDGEERRRAFGVMGLVIGVAAASGQLVGGALIGGDVLGLGWRLVFLVNLPIGIVAVVTGLCVLDESRAAGAVRLDPAGVGLSTLGLACLLGALIGLHALGGVASLGLAAIALPVLALFAWHENRFEQKGHMPLLSIRLFRLPAFVIGILLVLVFYVTMNSFYMSLAVLLQFGYGNTALQAALIFTPISVVFAAASLLAPRLTRRHGIAVLRWGAMLNVLGYGALLLLMQFAADRPAILALMPALLVAGIGQGLILTPLLNVILGMLPETHAGMAAGAISTMQQLGGAFGVALMGLALFGSGETHGVMAAAAVLAGFGRAMVLQCAATLVTYALLRRFSRPRMAQPAL
jgi:EmrB/QacA subfamily drug resistance transporter